MVHEPFISPLHFSHQDPLQLSPLILSLPSISTFFPVPIFSPYPLLPEEGLPSYSCHLFSLIPINPYLLHIYLLFPYTPFLPLSIFPVQTPTALGFHFPSPSCSYPSTASPPFSPLLLIPTAPPILPPHSWVLAHMYFLRAHQVISSLPFIASAPCRSGHWALFPPIPSRIYE